MPFLACFFGRAQAFFSADRERQVSVFPGGVSSAFAGFEVTVLGNMCGCLEQLKAHLFAAVPANGELLAHEECHLMVLAMRIVHNEIESCPGSSLARLVGWFRHRFLPTSDRPLSTATVFERLTVTKGGAATYDT
jgi:hypothetical protein